MIEYYGCNITMFGMNDPTQTLMQLEGYIRDGRLEMSEVMATQFTDMFLRNKKRSTQQQIMLVLIVLALVAQLTLALLETHIILVKLIAFQVITMEQPILLKQQPYLMLLVTPQPAIKL